MADGVAVSEEKGGRAVKSARRVFYKYLPIWSCVALLLGVLLARSIPAFGDAMAQVMSRMVDGYGVLAPIAIFLVLAPSLAKILSLPGGNGKLFACYAIWWFAKLRLAACLFAILFVALVFKLPLWRGDTVGLGEACFGTMKSLGKSLVTSPYFYAVYVSLIATAVSLKVSMVARWLQRCEGLVESIGGRMVSIVPFFMLAVGTYIYQLPKILRENMGESGAVGALRPLDICGITIHAETGAQLFVVYCVGALLTGIACVVWHLGLLAVAKSKMRSFSLRTYFARYWVRVYPLLWATSSEALAMPLNLYLTRKYWRHTRPEVCRLAVGSGSFLSINGTMICVFLLAALVAKLLGIEVTVLQFLLSMIFIFLLGYGVPGIPGELILFAGPLVELLGVPPSVAPTFLLLYVGLQIGLPDSFRTGANSTDNCVSCLLLNEVYEERFVEHGLEHGEATGLEEVVTPSAALDHPTA